MSIVVSANKKLINDTSLLIFIFIDYYSNLISILKVIWCV